MTEAQYRPGPLAGLRVLELADEKGQFCGKLLGDLGADVIKIEPPGGEATRRVGPFLDDIPHPDRSLSFWYYNTSKRGRDAQPRDDRRSQAFRRLAATADVLLETFPPGHLASLRLDDQSPSRTKSPSDYMLADPLRPNWPLAGLRELATCCTWQRVARWLPAAMTRWTAPGAPPIAPGGGNAWHMGGHFAYMAIMAALVYRSVAGQGQYIDASIHEACALTTESAIANYVYRGETLLRQTGRHHAPAATPRTQFRSKDGNYVTALVAGRLIPTICQGPGGPVR